MTEDKAISDSTSYRLAAVMDVGSTSIRMEVAQINRDGAVCTLDSLSQSVAIGSDTFTRGRISRSTIEECVQVMRNFSAVLAEYRIDPVRDIRIVATSAVREARNRDEFLDRIYMATGMNVEVIEGTEVSRLTFFGIRPLLSANRVLQGGHLLAAEVGGGSTELLGLEDGRVSFAHTYRLGAYRLSESMAAQQGSDARRREVLDMEIEAGVRQCRETLTGVSPRPALLLMGSEARLAAKLADREWDEKALLELRVPELARLAERMLAMGPEQIVRMYHLALEEAQTLGPALQVYVKLAGLFRLKRVFVCGVTLRDGLLAEAATGNAWTDDFVEQIFSSVKEIGRKYSQDEAHADCVTQNALAIFRAMQSEHQLGVRCEVILRVAGQLHEVGMFVNSSGHHKHSQYLIENSEIFGLSEQDIQMAALVARYHRRAFPKSSHPGYASLPREKRLTVSKLAAILRAADALDRSHTQSVRNIKVSMDDRQLMIEPSRTGEFGTEKRALVEKSKLFEQVYGRRVVLCTKRK